MSLAHSALLAAQEAAIAANVASAPTPITKLTFDNASARLEDTGSSPTTFSTLGTPAYVDHGGGKALDLSVAQLLLYKDPWSLLNNKTTATIKCDINRAADGTTKDFIKWGSKFVLKTDSDNKVSTMIHGTWITGTTVLATNTWYAIKVTISVAAGFKLYVNGVLENSTTIASGFDGTSPEFDIGFYQAGAGYIDSVEVYDVVV